jgi:NhaP-type Na+/H+ or K+/H+ antiporter
MRVVCCITALPFSSFTDTVILKVLALGLFAIGVELPKSYLAKHAKGLLVMVVPTMAFGWAAVAGGLIFLIR